MFRHLLALAAIVFASLSFAADVNKAGAPELDAIKGIGPTMSQRILDERKNGPFKDWADFIARVKGVGEAKAAKLSEEGLTVNGQPFKTVKAGDKATEKTGKTSDKATDKAEARKKEDKKG